MKVTLSMFLTTNTTVTNEKLNELISSFKDDRISALQNNLSYVMTYFTILIAIVGLVTTFVIMYLNKKYKENYEERLEEIDKIKEETKKYFEDVSVAYQEVIRSEKEVKSKDGIMTSKLRVLTKKLNQTIELHEKTDSLKSQISYLEGKQQKLEISNTFKEIDPIVSEKLSFLESQDTLHITDDDWSYHKDSFIEIRDELKKKLNYPYTYDLFLKDEHDSDWADTHIQDLSQTFDEYEKYMQDIIEIAVAHQNKNS
ncbi:hypothetical protein LCM20_04285 [Halobacillus litoralis]|uniref:hypothetical protein n=1 Tax=Halobacillus litoralis TaxID=45668 RepID=UPI001CD414CC|nr:hypothetical protein [Halobacillus litoralis]MCA0969796.1 hypothetical protein [Halobacillus litoralis]